MKYRARGVLLSSSDGEILKLALDQTDKMIFAHVVLKPANSHASRLAVEKFNLTAASVFTLHLPPLGFDCSLI